MKAILEFNLPEDNDDYKIATNAVNMSLAIWDMKQWFRSQLKYPSEDITDEKLQVIEDCSKAFYECLESNKVNLDL